MECCTLCCCTAVLSWACVDALQGLLPSLQDDFEVCLDEDATPSGTPVRQLRSPAERAPTAKAAAMVADRLQKSPEGAGLKVSSSRSSNLSHQSSVQAVFSCSPNDTPLITGAKHASRTLQ